MLTYGRQCAGHDRPFVNNYGVWTDEFRELGLEHTLEGSWQDALCYFGDGPEVRIQRSYSRCLQIELASIIALTPCCALPAASAHPTFATCQTSQPNRQPGHAGSAGESCGSTCWTSARPQACSFSRERCTTSAASHKQTCPRSHWTTIPSSEPGMHPGNCHVLQPFYELINCHGGLLMHPPSVTQSDLM